MIFISYKSNYANLIRNIGESLIAGGQKIWFAEHEVLPENYDDFLLAIDNGIQNSQYAIFFTNKLWQNSNHCQYEKKGLLNKLSSDCVLEICLKENSQNTRGSFLSYHTNNLFRVECNYDCIEVSDVVNILKKIEQIFQFELTSYPKKATLDQWSYLPSIGIGIQSGILQAKLTDNIYRGSNFLSPLIVYKSQYNGIDIGLAITITPFDSVLKGLAKYFDEEYDDRQLYNSYRNYADKWVKTYFTNSKVYKGSQMYSMGLHLLFKENHSHLGLTYYTIFDSHENNITWERRYVIPIHGDSEKETGEANLVFYAKLSGTKDIQFQNFCQFSTLFDSIARSFVYQTPRGLVKFVNNLAPFIVKSLYGFGLFGLALYLTTLPINIAYTWITMFFSGLFIADLVFYIKSLTYQRVTWLMQPVQDNLATSLYELLSTSIFRTITLYPFVQSIAIFFGIKRILKKWFKLLPLVLFSLLIIFDLQDLHIPLNIQIAITLVVVFWAGINIGYEGSIAILDRYINKKP